MIRLAVLLALACAGAAGAQTAQHHRGGDGAITLYEHVNYQGRSVRIDGEAPNLTWLNFNDLTSSMRVEGGRWEVCIHDNYDGACQVIDSDNRDMSSWNFNDRITSVRPVQFRGRDREAGVTLYSEFGYRGRSVTVIDPVEHLNRFNFNDVPRSIEVHAGAWTVCVDDDYQGGCRVIDRSVSDLRRLRMDRRITSLRPGRIDQPPHRDPGYGAPGYGAPGYGGSAQVRGGVRGVDSVFFATPEIGGYAVSACLFENDFRCGREAAEALCDAAGLDRALHYDTRYAGSDRLWLIGEDRPGRAREAVVDLLCER